VQLAVQRKISGSFFKRVAPQYLLLLAISPDVSLPGQIVLEVPAFEGDRRGLVPADKAAPLFLRRRGRDRPPRATAARPPMTQSEVEEGTISDSAEEDAVDV
jgi:hypothetical protein